MRRALTRLTTAVSEAYGSLPAVALAHLSVVVYLAVGWWMPGRWLNPDYSLAGTLAMTVVTYLMVFAIENTQQRSDRALHTKIDRLIELLPAEQKALVALEDEPDDRIRDEQERVRRQA